MDKPKEIPRIVYKYRSWSDNFHRNLLNKNELFFASPKDFNDPFDCKVFPDFSSLNSNESISEFVDKSIRNYAKHLLRDGRNIQSEKEKLSNRLKNDNPKFQKEYEDNWPVLYENKLGILSLSKRWDSILMWAHYADKHQGYCIGFSVEKLNELEDVSYGGLVNYEEDDSYPGISPLLGVNIERLVIETQTKAYDWHYEEEYRLFKFFDEKDPSTKKRILYFDNDLIAEVIIGLFASKENKNEIKNICLQKGIVTYEIEKVPFKFKFQRKLCLA